MNPLSKLWGWATAHVRLAIEYVILVAVIVLASFAWYYRVHSAQQDTEIARLGGSLSAASATIDAQAQTNREQDEAIGQLRDLRDRDNDAILGLQLDLTTAGKKQAEVRTKLSQLEANNARAKALLDLVVPPDVGCVLDRRPCPTAQSDDANRSRASQAR